MDEVLGEAEWTVEDYLAQFDPGSPDYALLRTRAGNLRSVTVRRVRDASGRLFEDTVFVEKTGVSYTIRAKI